MSLAGHYFEHQLSYADHMYPHHAPSTATPHAVGDKDLDGRRECYFPATKIVRQVNPLFLIFLITSLCAQPVTTPATFTLPLLRKGRGRCPIARLHRAVQPPYLPGRLSKSICLLTLYFCLLLRSIPQHTISLPTILLLILTYIPLRILSPQTLLPLIGSLFVFGATQHTLLNPTTLTGGLLTLYHTQSGLRRYINPTLALNLCTTDSLLLAITGFYLYSPPTLPTRTFTLHRRLILFMVILFSLITPVEAIPSLQDADILSKAATLLSSFWLRSRAQAEDEPGEQPLPPLDTPTMLGNPSLPTTGLHIMHVNIGGGITQYDKWRTVVELCSLKKPDVLVLIETGHNNHSSTLKWLTRNMKPNA